MSFYYVLLQSLAKKMCSNGCFIRCGWWTLRCHYWPIGYPHCQKKWFAYLIPWANKSSIALPKQCWPTGKFRGFASPGTAKNCGRGVRLGCWPRPFVEKHTGSKWPWNSRRISWIHNKGCKISQRSKWDSQPEHQAFQHASVRIWHMQDHVIHDPTTHKLREIRVCANSEGPRNNPPKKNLQEQALANHQKCRSHGPTQNWLMFPIQFYSTLW